MIYSFGWQHVFGKMCKRGMQRQQDSLTARQEKREKFHSDRKRLRAAYFAARKLEEEKLGENKSGEETPKENKSDNGECEEGASKGSDEVEENGPISDRELFGHLSKLEGLGGEDSEDKTAPETWSEIEYAEKLKWWAIETAQWAVDTAQWAWLEKNRFLILESSCREDFTDFWDLVIDVEDLARDFFFKLYWFRIALIPVEPRQSDVCYYHQHDQTKELRDACIEKHGPPFEEHPNYYRRYL